MARPRPPDRLERVLRAAEQCFLARGLQRTKMSDVARAAAVSEASLYYYFASKDSLYEWALIRAWDPTAALPAVLPIEAPDPEPLEAVFAATQRGVADYPLLAAAVSATAPGDLRDEVVTLLAESFEVLHRNRRWIDLAHAGMRADASLSSRWMQATVGGPDNLWVHYFESRRPSLGVEPWDGAVFVDINLHYFARIRPTRRDPRLAHPMADDVAPTVIRLVAEALMSGRP